MVGKQPNYELSGVHAGVKVNLHYQETNDALFHHGRFEYLPRMKDEPDIRTLQGYWNHRGSGQDFDD
jgi:hypothetical protein